MPKHIRKTNTRVNPPRDRYIAQTSQPDSFFHKYPAWRFQFMDKDVWSPIGHLDEISEKLSSYEKISWAEIDGTPKSGAESKGSQNHFVSVNDMIRQARIRLNNLHLTFEEYYSIALTGKERLWGVLNDGVFYILWYDQNHEVCPSVMKHT